MRNIGQRLRRTDREASERLSWLRYKETHLRLLAYLAAPQAKLNIWTAPFESLESVESNLNDWIYFMDMQQFDKKLLTIADKMEAVTEECLKTVQNRR